MTYDNLAKALINESNIIDTIYDEVNSFSKIVESVNILNENGILLEAIDKEKLKEKAKKIISNIVEFLKKVKEWLKEKIEAIKRWFKKIFDKARIKKADDDIKKVKEKIKSVHEDVNLTADKLKEILDSEIMYLTKKEKRIYNSYGYSYGIPACSYDRMYKDFDNFINAVKKLLPLLKDDFKEIHSIIRDEFGYNSNDDKRLLSFSLSYADNHGLSGKSCILNGEEWHPNYSMYYSLYANYELTVKDFIDKYAEKSGDFFKYDDNDFNKLIDSLNMIIGNIDKEMNRIGSISISDNDNLSDIIKKIKGDTNVNEESNSSLLDEYSESKKYINALINLITNMVKIYKENLDNYCTIEGVITRAFKVKADSEEE